MADAPPKAPVRSLPWLGPFIVVSLAVLGPFLLYFLLYASDRAADAKRERFNALSLIARDLQARTELLAQIVTTAAWSSDCPFAAAGAGAASPVRVGPVKPEAVRCVEKQLRQASGPPLNLEVWRRVLNSKPAGESPHNGQRIQTRVAPISLPMDPRLQLSWRVEDAQYADEVAASVRLRDLVPWEAIQEEFDALIIRLPKAEGDTAESTVVFAGSGTSAELIRTEMPPPAPEKSSEGLSSKARTAVSDPLFGDLPTVTVGSTDYYSFRFSTKLYVPARTDAGNTPAASARADQRDVEITGLVLPAALRQQALALSPLWVSLVMTALLGAFLALPYLKVRFMARRERLRALDMWFLGAATFTGAAIATLMILHLHSHLTLQSQVDQGMKTVAERIQTAVREEVTEAIDQLKTAGIHLATNGACSKPAAAGSGMALLRDEKLLPHSEFEALFCTDDTGMQLRKWTTRTIVSPMVSVRERPVFAKALKFQSPGKNGPDFAFDAVETKTTGLDLAFFGLPLDAHEPKIGSDVPLPSRTGVAMLATRLRSLGHAIVPFPYEYVVLARDDDRVLFRSGAARTLRDDFLKEVSTPETLRLAMHSANASGSLPGDWRYRGQVHRMQAFALNDLPATLVVSYNKAVVESVSAEALLNALFWVALLTIACCVAAALAGWRRGAMDLIWPMVAHWPVYVLSCAVFLGFAVALVLVVPAQPVWLRPYILVLAPAVFLVASAWTADTAVGRRCVSWICRADPGQAWRQRLYPAVYQLACVLGLTAVAAVPAWLFYADAAQAHRAAFEHLSATRVHHLKQKRERAEELRFLEVPDTCTIGPNSAPAGKSERRDGAQPACIEQIKSKRAADDRILITKFRKDGLRLRAGVYDPVWPLRCPPGDGCAEVGSTYFSRLSSGIIPAITMIHPDLAAHVVAVDVAGEPSSNTRPLWSNEHGYPALAVWLPFLIIVLAAWWFVESVAKHILGLEFEGDGVLDRSREVTGHAHRRWLLLRPTRAALDTVKKAFGHCPVDLSNTAWTREAVMSLPPSQPLLILNVESRIDSAEWRKTLAQLLSMPPDRELVVTSAIDPLHYLVGRLKEASSDADHTAFAGELHDWALATATLEKGRYAKPPANPNVPPGADPHLVERLDQECRWSDVLRGIQCDLLNRPDFAQLDWSDIVDYVHDIAEPYYWVVWNLCSEEEKLTLIQLAQEGVVNPRAFDVLRRLRRRRLVRTDPRFRVVNESFTKFVFEAETTTQVKEWEKPATGQTWARLRTPLLAVLFVAVLLLFYTEQPFFNSMLAVMGTGVAAVSSVGAVVARAKAAFTSKATA